MVAVMTEKSHPFPALKSQEEIEAEDGMSGLFYSLVLICGGSASVLAFGIGYAFQSWWLAW